LVGLLGGSFRINGAGKRNDRGGLPPGGAPHPTALRTPSNKWCRKEESIRAALRIRPLSEPQAINGAGKRNRTSDLLITNELLYRLSYSGIN
jgi:hypothetical protein